MGRRIIRVGRILVFMTGFTTLALSALWLPWQAGMTARVYPTMAYLQYPLLLCVYLTLFPFLYVLHETDRLMGRAEEGTPVMPYLDRALKRMGIAYLLIGLLYLVACAILHREGAQVPWPLWQRILRPMTGTFLICAALEAARRILQRKAKETEEMDKSREA